MNFCNIIYWQVLYSLRVISTIPPSANWVDGANPFVQQSLDIALVEVLWIILNWKEVHCVEHLTNTAECIDSISNYNIE